jgi:hypothetical protein
MQHGAGETYAPTPSRIEMYVLLEIVVRAGWQIAHIDESRAFLSTAYKGETPIVASVRGVKGVYRVSGALYGLKTSPRDYHDEVVGRLTAMGFVRDSMCRCLGEDGRILSEAERRGYQRLIGSLLWIGGLRHDVAYALAYSTVPVGFWEESESTPYEGGRASLGISVGNVTLCVGVGGW